jgi:hypothetical protein
MRGGEPAVHSGRVISSDAAAEGRRRADELLTVLAADDPAGAERLLAGLTAVRELVLVGAGLTAVARAESRNLPPAQRAQANTRQERLGSLRDANAADPEGLRIWLRRAAEEVLLLRSQQAVADEVHAADQAWTAARVDAEANGTAAASRAPTST